MIVSYGLDFFVDRRTAALRKKCIEPLFTLVEGKGMAAFLGGDLFIYG